MSFNQCANANGKQDYVVSGEGEKGWAVPHYFFMAFNSIGLRVSKVHIHTQLATVARGVLLCRAR